MGAKDNPQSQYLSTSPPPPSPMWEKRVPRSNSAGCLEMTKTSSATTRQWHNSGPVSPDQHAKSPTARSSGSVSPIRLYMECIEPPTLKCAIVGDSGVGKTSLIMSYTKGEISDIHTPTVYDRFSTSISVYGKRIAITLCDTPGLDDFAPLRPLCYPELDAVLICFSVADSSSYENVKLKWSKEIRRHCPGVPIILVGTQIDKREDSVTIKQLKSKGLRTISRADGNKLASLIKATTYVECSSLKHLNVKNAFDEAIAAALELSKGSRKRTTQCTSSCTIL